MVVEGHGFVGDAEFGRRVNGELDGEWMIVGWHRGGWRVDAEIGLCVDIVVVGVCRASADRWLRVVVSGCNGRVVDYGVIFGQCREDYVFWWWWGAGAEAGVDWCGRLECVEDRCMIVGRNDVCILGRDEARCPPVV